MIPLTASQIMAKLPADFGFYPCRSVVLIAMVHEAGQLVVSGSGRFDIDRFAPDAALVPPSPLLDGAHAVGVAVIDDRPDQLDVHRAHLRRIQARVSKDDIPVVFAYATPEIADGAPWWSLNDDGRNGLIILPEDLTGNRPIYRGRAEAVAALEAVDPAGADATRELIFPAVRDLDRILAAVGEDTFLHNETRYCADLIRDHPSGATLTPATAAEIAARVLHKNLADRLLFARTDDHRATAAFWRDVARLMPDNALRCKVLTLHGFHAFASGGTAAGRLGLEAALREDPHNVMTRLLHHMVATLGLRPEKVREIVAKLTIS
ncbi:DUF4192 domain-containing protein (plasmid) [Nocardia sp. NBC_01377]|uniref:DUF4192 domain-containing protein n=1 Tax=Nocardia sp. NBC_01377 TaxID=2903595 RepID=UPI0032462A53